MGGEGARGKGKSGGGGMGGGCERTGQCIYIKQMTHILSIIRDGISKFLNETLSRIFRPIVMLNNNGNNDSYFESFLFT